LPVLVAALVLASPAAAWTRGETVELRAPSQAAILDTGSVSVTVRSGHGSFAPVAVGLRGRGLLAAGVVRLRGGGGSAALPLLPGARARIAACDPGVLVARTFAARDAEQLYLNTARCRAQAPVIDVKTGCDPMDPSVCLQPFPNDLFTMRDPGTATGRRLALSPDAMPRNRGGTPVDPTDINRFDGFSPGNLIVTHVPGLDNQAAFQRTGLVPITDMARAYDRRQPAVLIDAETGRRQLIWAEIDSLAHNPQDVNLILRPGKNLREGGRFIVALRRLRDANGNIIQPSPAFRLYRDRIVGNQPEIESRRAHMEDVFARLKRAGVSRRDLYLAWDFTVASERSLSQRMLHIRDDAFAQLGDHNLADGKVQGVSPRFEVTQVTDWAPCDPDGCKPGQDPDIRRRVEGTVDVPCYLNQQGCPPGSQFALGPDGLPTRTPGNVMKARFICNIPQSAVQGGAVRKLRPALYGHGLFGDASEANARNVRQLGNENGVLVCATDWSGMSEEDVPNAAGILQDLSKFPTLADRDQQGFLNFLYLGRALSTADGLVTAPQMQIGGKPVIDTSQLGYYGNSQGGIMGGALTALAPDFTRSVLYVPGMNYSTLMTRSVDFADFTPVLYYSYPNEIERPLLFALIQLMWDRGEPNGYAEHMTGDPLPNTPRHTVLIEMAYGDHQVANVATEVEARTIGARVRRPSLDPGRSPDVTPQFGIPPLGRLPQRSGNAFIVWDIGPLRTENGQQLGTPSPPTTNTPPSIGVDPHDTVIRSESRIRHQIAEFMHPGGSLIEVCGERPCYAAGWTGAP